MFTTRDAARLLSAVRSITDLGALTDALGFGRSLAVPRSDRARLTLEHEAAAVRVAPGRGPLRALLMELDGETPVRERIHAVSRALSLLAPETHWLLLARERRSGAVTIAAPAPEGNVRALMLHPAQVRESDADTFASLVECVRESDLLVHLRWRETLGRDALSARFYRDLERCVDTLAREAEGQASATERRTIALLHTSRLLFLAFLEAKGWLDADRSFLRRHFARCVGAGSTTGAHRRLLEPLFFGTLNTPVSQRSAAARAFGRLPFLNGGLFARTPLERRRRVLRFTDAAIGEVIGGLLARYRVTAHEASREWSDAAIDPEMLGRAFESLMAPAERRSHGTFYTPHAIIARITRGALDLATGVEGAAPGLEQLDAVRLLDPACGSGAFLVFALEELAARRVAAGDRRDLAVRRRHVLAHNIFGVDIDPTAVWLCQLRLWLSVVVEDPSTDPTRLAPLPNLDRNVREGDSLTGRVEPHAFVAASGSLERLRLRYTRASGVRKRTLARALDRAERSRAIADTEARIRSIAGTRREILLTLRGRDLFHARTIADSATRRTLASLRAEARAARTLVRRLRDGHALPFAFSSHFADAMQCGRFTVVVGNPPWVRPHAIAAGTRVALRDRFFVLRHAAWEAGAEASAAGRGFSSQADLAAVFVERAIQLATPGGIVALLVPAKLWRSLSGGGVRQYLARHAPPIAFDEWDDAHTGFDAAVYPGALLARKGPGTDIAVTRHEADGAVTWTIAAAHLALDESPGAPWLLVRHEERAAFDALAAAGVPLASSPFGRPLLGVKSGCNAAFVVAHHSRGAIESALLRPLLRGEDLRPWAREEAPTPDAILWTHDRRGAPLTTLPHGAQRWLAPWRAHLEARSDARRGRWWALFRTEAARTDRPRVVWGDIGRAPRALVLPAGDPTVPLNTCYVVRAPSDDDAHALAALLNSPLAAAWLGCLAEPARGGYRRFLGWTCARFPVPRDWASARAVLAPLGRAGAAGKAPDTGMLHDAVLRAYGLPAELVAALVSCQGR